MSPAMMMQQSHLTISMSSSWPPDQFLVAVADEWCLAGLGRRRPGDGCLQVGRLGDDGALDDAEKGVIDEPQDVTLEGGHASPSSASNWAVIHASIWAMAALF